MRNVSKIVSALWLLVLLCLLAASLLCLFPAPNYRLWTISLSATELGWKYSAVVLLLLLATPWVRYRLPGVLIGFAAIGIYSYPLCNAYLLSRNLKGRMEQALGKVPAGCGATPFNIWRAIAGGTPYSGTYKQYQYAVTDSFILSLDYYKANASGPRPCIVVLHGGGWHSGSSGELPHENWHLAEMGYNVASLNYRLAPYYHYPAPVEDVATALAYLSSHADSLGIDTAAFVLLGRSAGGQVALQAAYTLTGEGIVGVISMSAPTDLAWGYEHPCPTAVYDLKHAINGYLGGEPTQVPNMYLSSNPIVQAKKNSVPTLLIHGSNDAVVHPKHSLLLHQQLTRLRAPHYLLAMPWATHGYNFTPYGPGGQLSAYAVDLFLCQVTGR